MLLTKYFELYPLVLHASDRVSVEETNRRRNSVAPVRLLRI